MSTLITTIRFAPCKGRIYCLQTGLIAALLLTATAVTGAPASITGRVFFDEDADGVHDESEFGLANVVVSDGHSVALSAGDGTYTIPNPAGPFVFVSLPRGYKSVGKFYAATTAGGTIDFPLADWPESRSEATRFVQVSDTHLDSTPESVISFKDDLAEITALEPQAAFILATGDLVHLGREIPQFDNYVEGIETLDLPLFNLPGNHDVGRSSGSLEHYHRYLGPDYYSFNFANCHFVLINGDPIDDDPEAIIAAFLELGRLPTEADLPERVAELPELQSVLTQLQWILQDLATAPSGSTIIFGTHYLPSTTMLKLFDALGAKAVLSGHWHGHRVREEGGVLDINSPPLRFGGIDRHPRSFRVIEVDEEGIRNELRLGGFDRHAVVVTPRGVQPTGSDTLPLLVNAYDTRWKVESVTCRIGDRTIPLRQTGDWSWAGEAKLTASQRGPQTVIATVRTENGESWQTEAKFELSDTPARLQLKWASPAGGFIGISSPAVSGSTVVVGSDDANNLDDCGVTAFSLDGTRRWHFPTDSAIKNRVALADGRVFATSVAGWLYALDEMSGELLWKAALGRELERWETTATVVAGDQVYVGSTGYVAGFEAATGQRLWDTTVRDDDWWPSSYTIPVMADETLLLSNLRYGATALSGEDGDIQWKLGGKFTGFAVEGDTAYTVWDEYPAAIDIQTGRTLWRSAEPIESINTDSAQLGVRMGIGTASNPVLAGDRAVIGTSDGRIVAFSTRDGTVLWNYQTGPSLTSMEPYHRGGSDVNSTPAVAEGLVYVGASDGYLHVISLADGTRVASYDLGVPIASSPVIRGGTVYIGAYDGNVYAFSVH